jgi:hypothetical protein
MKQKSKVNIVCAYRRYDASSFAVCSLLFALLLALCSSPLWAQTQALDGGRYVIEQRYVQQLVWIGDDYTLKYEVVIEKNEDNKYKAFLREFTEIPNLQISLPLGKYRYRVIPYDYLEHPGEASDWINIEINPPPVVTVEIQKNEDGNYAFSPYVSAAWSPLIPLYGRMYEILGNNFYPFGVSVHFGALYNKLQWFKPGIELSTSWYALNNAQSIDIIGISTGITGLNIVAQIPLSNRMAVTLKTGAAILFQVSEIKAEDFSFSSGGLIPQINVEASFLWFAYKKLFLEAGLGFYHLLNEDDDSGLLRPWLGMGWRF